jgi:hypothetical protein
MTNELKMMHLQITILLCLGICAPEFTCVMAVVIYYIYSLSCLSNTLLQILSQYLSDFSMNPPSGISVINVVKVIIPLGSITVN